MPEQKREAHTAEAREAPRTVAVQEVQAMEVREKILRIPIALNAKCLTLTFNTQAAVRADHTAANSQAREVMVRMRP